jgi:hypothetical protein
MVEKRIEKINKVFTSSFWDFEGSPEYFNGINPSKEKVYLDLKMFPNDILFNIKPEKIVKRNK